MATDVKSGAEGEDEEGGEFAEFMADISQEIAQRVASLSPSPKSTPAQRKEPTPARDPGIIQDWDNIADRMIEEMR
ncbi:MAG: hypothetical protein ACR2NS_02915 [Gemmatimonadaceae bacterium]